jgi:hypothetical protein
MASTPAQDWIPCPEGELDRLTARMRSARLCSTLFAVVACVVTAVGMAAASWALTNALWPSPPVADAPACPVPVCPGGAPPKQCPE